MADFLPAYERMIVVDEGGYKLTDIPGDLGGLTYAGIARKMNPQWAGWAAIDRGETPPTSLVRDFYRAGWWAPIRGDDIRDQRVAVSLFSFAVNSSAWGRPATAVKLAQIVLGVTPDGFLGDKTLAALNAYDPPLFLAHYALARVARRAATCNKDRTQEKFLLGWINRDLGSLQ